MRTSLASLVLLLASLTPVTGNYGDSPYAHKLFPPRGTRVDPEDQVCEPPTTLTTTTNPPRSEPDGVQPFPRR